MPSPAEGFGRVTAEAMASGMTIIGRRDAAATVELLEDPPYSVGMLAGTPEEAAGQVIYLMQETNLLERLKQQALQWGDNHFTLERARAGFFKALNIER